MRPSFRIVKTTKVGFVLVEDYALMSIAAGVEPLRAANLLSGRIVYEMTFLALAGHSAKASVGASFETLPVAEAGTDFDIVFVVAGGNPFEIADPTLDAWLRRLDRVGVRLGGISGGAAILCAAGLMEQRRFTIHWHHYDALSERFPEALMERRLFVIDRDRYTCAGGVAPLDMMYALMAADHGVPFARKVSDWFLHTQIRPSQNPQRASPAEKYAVHHPALTAAVELMEAHIADPLDAEQLAALCAVSPRQLHRLFRQQIGTSLGAFYTALRIEKARELLGQTSLPIVEVGLATGYYNRSYFTRIFRVTVGVTPSRFRRPVKPPPA
jgi:transcriptional regulator GlxA family with amidase domain